MTIDGPAAADGAAATGEVVAPPGPGIEHPDDAGPDVPGAAVMGAIAWCVAGVADGPGVPHVATDGRRVQLLGSPGQTAVAGQQDTAPAAAVMGAVAWCVAGRPGVPRVAAVGRRVQLLDPTGRSLAASRADNSPSARIVTVLQGHGVAAETAAHLAHVVCAAFAGRRITFHAPTVDHQARDADVRAARAAGQSLGVVSRRFGLSRSHVRRICGGLP